MPERGGPTTQSGIYYQNAVAALYLGRLYDSLPRTKGERVIHVRVEAPTAVDDTVVTYDDEHNAYIQAKEAIRTGEDAWNKLWRDFAAQFLQTGFQRGSDRLILHIGRHRNDHDDLDELCERARESNHYSEWWNRLTRSQQRLVERIKPNLKPELLNDADLVAFFAHVEIEIWTLRHIERDLAPRWMPPSSVSVTVLYRLFHNHVGGKARTRGTFTANALRWLLEREKIYLDVSPDVRVLRDAVRGCGALLRAYRSTIGRVGQHIQRSIVSEIVTWTRTVTGDKRVAMLLDHAGMGKTVVMRAALEALDALGITTLAIKADQQLSGVSVLADLPARLHLPETVEQVVARLAALEPVVVLIDQIDALSLSLAHDQDALNTVLDLVARLSRIPGVAIVLSCRTFDRNSDPRLKRIEVATVFHLAELSDVEVSDVLQANDIDFARLEQPLKKLLRVPLHLDLFVRALEGRERPQNLLSLRGIASLQDLYDLLWRNVLLKQEPGSPPAAEREAVIHLIADQMNRNQRTSVSETILMTSDTKHLEQAVTWLASTGVLIQGDTEWGFLHQTFFDYCYAKQFVARGESLAQTVLSGDQGLFTRPQIVQVLSYLRGRNITSYLQELQQLLTPSQSHPHKLRIHLRDLLLRWFGSLPNPTDAEWTVAHRMLIQPSMRPHVLRAMHANPGWFARLNGKPLQEMLVYDDQTLDTQLVPYLASMLEISQAQIVGLIGPYLGRDDQWNNRVAHIVSTIRNWHTREAADLFERLCQLFPAFHFNHLYDLGALVAQHPQTVCRLVRLAFDRKLAQFTEQQSATTKPYLWTLSSELEKLNSGSLVEILHTLSEQRSADFLAAMIPWLEQLLSLSGQAPQDYPHFIRDEFAFHWHDRTFAVRYTLRRCLIRALTHQAQANSDIFRSLAQRLGALPYETPQLLLANTYEVVADLYAEDALNYLRADQRRLDLGDNLYDSRQLVASLYPHLSPPQRQELEDCILGYAPVWKWLGIDALRRRGLEQLFLLQSIPQGYLSPHARTILRAWERKFPGMKASEEPATAHFGFVGSPINTEAAKKMSDRAWLRAIRKYQQGVSHREPFKGGAYELSGVLVELVKEEPERFYRLLQRMAETPAEPYAIALLNGLAESTAPAEWLFATVRRFASHPGGEIPSAIARVLERRVEDGVPDDLVDLLAGYVHAPTLEIVEDDKDPYHRYLNSTRGAALRSLMRVLDRRAIPEATARKWELIEIAATDPASALRAGAIEELRYILRHDRARAVSLFAQLMDGHPDLLRSHYTQEFVYYGMYRHFGQMQPFIRALMDAVDEQSKQQGAILACIAAMSPKALESEEYRASAQTMASEALVGDPALRRGAAIVYTRNILSPEVGPICLRVLLTLLDDDDDGVQGYISGVFRSLRADHVISMRGFIEAYAASPMFYNSSHQFLDYLAEHGLLDPQWTLTVIEMILQNTHQSDEARWYRGGSDLIRIVLRIYTDPTADSLVRSRAMDVFDQLMERYGGEAQLILSEWDDR